MVDVFCKWCRTAHTKSQKRFERASTHYCSPDCHKRHRRFAMFCRRLVWLKRKLLTNTVKKTVAVDVWQTAMSRCAKNKKSTTFAQQWSASLSIMAASSRLTALTMDIKSARQARRNAKRQGTNASLFFAYVQGVTHRENAAKHGLTKQYVEAKLRRIRLAVIEQKLSWNTAINRLCLEKRKDSEWRYKLNNLVSGHRKRMDRKAIQIKSRHPSLESC